MTSPAPMTPGMPGRIGAAVGVSFLHTLSLFRTSRVTPNGTAQYPRDACLPILRGV